MTILTIGIGGTKLAVVLTGADGQIHDRRELPTPASQTPRTLRGALSASASPLQAHVQRAVIASTEIIRDGNLLALGPHSLGRLLHFPLAKTLKQLTNLPTIVTNDAQITAWAEYQALDGDITDTVLITVSIDVGGGVMSDDKLRTGSSGLARHIGHALIGPHGPVCDCGRTGYVGAITSGRGTATVAWGESAGANAKTIFARAGQGDEQTQQLIHRFARTLARLIADIKVTTDCQYVVADSSVDLAGGYLALVETYLVQGPATFHVDLLATHHRHDAGLFGAALLIQEEIL